MATKKHNHKIQRHVYTNDEVVFFCVLDDCNFKINAELSIGKSFQCWRCNNSFQMTVLTKRMKRPHCDDCTNKRDKSKVSINDLELVEVGKTSQTKRVLSSAEDIRTRLRSSIRSSLKDVSSVIPRKEDNPTDEDDML